MMRIPLEFVKCQINNLLAPKASEASWGLSIFVRGSKWLLLSVCVSGYSIVCGKEVTVLECAIGGLQKCPKFTCSGHTF